MADPQRTDAAARTLRRLVTLPLAILLLFCVAITLCYSFGCVAGDLVLIKVQPKQERTDVVLETDSAVDGRTEDVPGDDRGRSPRDFMELWPGG